MRSFPLLLVALGLLSATAAPAQDADAAPWARSLPQGIGEPCP